ncbi:hypothetical protein RCH11_000749 [Glaciihabitans sp. GrIS 2.15]|nr:hypothetical protein [Glaciihabitans sp. GrIS 2.15]
MALFFSRRKNDPTFEPAVIALSKAQPASEVRARAVPNQRGIGVTESRLERDFASEDNGSVAGEFDDIHRIGCQTIDGEK